MVDPIHCSSPCSQKATWHEIHRLIRANSCYLCILFSVEFELKAKSAVESWELHRPRSGMKDEEDPFIRCCGDLGSHLSPVQEQRDKESDLQAASLGISSYFPDTWLLESCWILLICVFRPVTSPVDVLSATRRYFTSWRLRNVKTLQQLISLSNLTENCCGNAFEDFPAKAWKTHIGMQFVSLAVYVFCILRYHGTVYY